MAVSSNRKLSQASSPASSLKKVNFFNKLIRKRDSSSAKASPSSSSTKISFQNDDKLNRNSSVRGRANTQDDSYVDTDSGEMNDSDGLDLTDESSAESSLLRAMSVNSLDKSVSTAFDGSSDVWDKIYPDQPLTDNFAATDAKNAWDGYNKSGFAVPKYVRSARRSKQSPQLVRKIFLAQELNSDLYNSEDEEEVVQDPEEKKVHDNILNTNPNKNSYVSGKMNREIFVMQFSKDGKYLAVAGRDSVIKVWKIISSPLARMEFNTYKSEHPDEFRQSKSSDPIYPNSEIFHQKPVRIFKGHSSSVLSLDWSKNNFLISGSMDRTVKLWHVDRPDYLASFPHDDFVTTVAFHPTDDRFFISGCLDNNARLWSIIERSTAYVKHLGDEMLITAVAFTPDGEHCLFGGFNGRLYLLETKGLDISHKFDIKQRSLMHLGHKEGRKITDIRIFDGGDVDSDNVAKRWSYLITTNDSRIRLVNSQSKKLVTRFRGATNTSSIAACMTDDMKYVISGSEDHWVYIWENDNYVLNNKVKTVVRDMIQDGMTQLKDLKEKHRKYYDLIHKNKLIRKLNLHQLLEDDGIVSNDNFSYGSFHAHHSSVNTAIVAPQLSKKLLELSDDLVFDLIRRSNICSTALQKLEAPEAAQLPLETSEDDNEGMIIVTTDEYGLIRVYRHDPAYSARNRLIGLYKKNKDKDSPDKCAAISLAKAGTKKLRSVSPVAQHDNIKSKLQSKMKRDSSLSSLSKSKSLKSVSSTGRIQSSKGSSTLVSQDQIATLNIGRGSSKPVTIEDLNKRLPETFNTGAISPEVEKKTAFPSVDQDIFPVSKQNSKQGIPIVINTQDLDQEDDQPQALEFQTPVTNVKDIKFDRIEDN